MSGPRNYALDSSFLIYHHYKGDGATEDILKALRREGYIWPTFLRSIWPVPKGFGIGLE